MELSTRIFLSLDFLWKLFQSFGWKLSVLLRNQIRKHHKSRNICSHNQLLGDSSTIALPAQQQKTSSLPGGNRDEHVSLKIWLCHVCSIPPQTKVLIATTQLRALINHPSMLIIISDTRYTSVMANAHRLSADFCSLILSIMRARADTSKTSASRTVINYITAISEAQVNQSVFRARFLKQETWVGFAFKMC